MTSPEIVNFLRERSNQQRIKQGIPTVVYPKLPTTPTPAPVPVQLPCRFRGLDVIDHFDCKSCGDRKDIKVPVYPCEKHGRCTILKSFAGTMCCHLCDDRQEPEFPKPFVSETNVAGAGIVLGFYGLPELARLQILTIRETCGSVPILIADDGSGRDADFRKLVEQYPRVEFWPNCERLGHYAGDLSVFYKGLQWASMKGLKWLCKLSQRFVWTHPGWLQSAVSRLESSRLATMMQNCMDNNSPLWIRSECVLFDVWRWTPHYREFAHEALGNPTELRVWHLVHSHFGGQYCPWTELPVDRYQRAAGTLWHGSHGDHEFRQFALSKGVELGPDFHTAGAERMPGWKRG